MKNSILIIIFSLLISSIWAQQGCTDPKANNYNPEAIINDGSCLYDPIILEPVVMVSDLSYAVAETSGIIWYREAIWSHNDSGGKPAIYKLDPEDGRLLQSIYISNATNIDYEDITQDEDYIYLGDTGNNFGNRKDLCIYKINKSDIPEEGDHHVSAQRIDYHYKDQNSFTIKNRRNDFDCEALSSIGDHLYLFSKNWVDGQTKCYQISKIPGNYSLEVFQSFNVRGLITAADYSPATRTLTLIGYENFVPFQWVFWDFEENDFFGGNKKRVDFAHIQGAQTEAICFKNQNEILITCEDSFYPSSLLAVDLNQILSSSKLNAPLFEPFRISLSPNVADRSVMVEIEGLKKEKFDIEIYDLTWKKVSQFSFIENRFQDKIQVSINTSELEQGIFFMRVKEGNNIGFQKLLITE